MEGDPYACTQSHTYAYTKILIKKHRVFSGKRSTRHNKTTQFAQMRTAIILPLNLIL